MLTAEGIFDAARVLVEAAEAEGAEVHVPLPVIDLDQPDVFAPERLAHIDPVTVPADAPVVTDAPEFIMLGILERGEPARKRSR